METNTNSQEVIDEIARLKKVPRSSMIAAPILAVLGVVCFFIPGSISTVFGFLLLGGAIAAFVIPYSINSSKARTLYKKNFIPSVLSKMFENVNYSYTSGFDESTVKLAGIPTGNIFHSDDLLTGVYLGVPFKVADVTTQQRTSDGKDTHTTTLFTGRMFIYDFNKEVNGFLAITEKMGPFNANFNRPYGLGKMQFESADFNDAFTVYSSNDHLAFYVITPQFIEAFMKLKAQIHGELNFNLTKNKLYVALGNCTNAFEVPSGKISIEKVTSRIELDAKPIQWFIDILNLDKDIFKEKDISKEPTKDSKKLS